MCLRRMSGRGGVMWGEVRAGPLRAGTYNSPHVVHADARLLEAVPALQAEQLTARPSL